MNNQSSNEFRIPGQVAQAERQQEAALLHDLQSFDEQVQRLTQAAYLEAVGNEAPVSSSPEQTAQSAVSTSIRPTKLVDLNAPKRFEEAAAAQAVAAEKPIPTAEQLTPPQLIRLGSAVVTSRSDYLVDSTHA